MNNMMLTLVNWTLKTLTNPWYPIGVTFWVLCIPRAEIVSQSNASITNVQSKHIQTQTTN